MVPRELMLTNKIPSCMFRALCGLAVCIFLVTGCGAPGPRALLSGEKLIRQGKYDQAIEKLERATQLMPKSAQAWNYLGLAYHGNNQPIRAIRAYRQALTLDNRLAPVRFNLGCAALEQNDLSSAIEQLTTFTYLQPNVADGWAKLGTAQLRANKIELAEKSLKSALELHPGNIEALNGLGLIQFQKRRFSEAFNFFNSATVENPNYAQALLNAAVSAQQNAPTRPQALQFYRRYLASKPAPEDSDKILAVANQLDAELNPPPRVIAQAAPPPAPARPAVKTNVVVGTTNSTAVAMTPRVAHATVPPTNSTIVVRTNAEIAFVPPPPKTIPRTNAIALSNSLAAAVMTKPTLNEPAFEITRVEDGFVAKPAQDFANSSDPRVARPTNSAVGTLTEATATATEGGLSENGSQAPSKSLLSRLNPFSGKSKTPSSPAGNVATGSTQVTMVEKGIAPGTATVSPVVARRYKFIGPVKPTSGNTAAAHRFLADGARAQQAGLLSQAIANYKRAIETDPGSFDAYYNLALVGLDTGNWDDALRAGEYALAINPEALNARYSFALALKQARYPQDAAEQFERILQSTPNDARVHLKLANVYAEQLKQPTLAKVHYERVLDLDPQHPQAAAIRSWLARNSSG